MLLNLCWTQNNHKLVQFSVRRKTMITSKKHDSVNKINVSMVCLASLCIKQNLSRMSHVTSHNNIITHCREWSARKANADVQMLVEAKSKPHDIEIYTDGSSTRDRSGWGFTAKQGTWEDFMKTVEPAEPRPPVWPWRGATHRLHMPTFWQTQWTCCKRSSLIWTAPTGTQTCTVFGCRDFCGSTVPGMPNSVGMNGQIDWKAHQIAFIWSAAWQGRDAQRLEEPSEHGQATASQHLSPEGKRIGVTKWPSSHPPR